MANRIPGILRASAVVFNDNDYSTEYDSSNEFHRECMLRTSEKMASAYHNVYNNLAIVYALIGGFGFSFALSGIKLSKGTRDNNVWDDDEFGKDVWTTVVMFTAALSITVSFMCTNMAQQIAQCPIAIFKDYFCTMKYNTMPFMMLGILYPLFFVSISLMASLMLYKVLFIIFEVVILTTFFMMGYFLMYRTTYKRLKLIKNTIRIMSRVQRDANPAL